MFNRVFCQYTVLGIFIRSFFTLKVKHPDGIVVKNPPTSNRIHKKGTPPLVVNDRIRRRIIKSRISFLGMVNLKLLVKKNSHIALPIPTI